MKKKVIASILTLMLAVQPCSIVSAAEITFTDGTEQSVEVQSEKETSQFEGTFQDGTSKAPEETESFESDATLGVSDGDSQENREQIGDNVWVTFEGDTATISGTGEMWDFYNDGWDFDRLHQNPFIEDRNIIQIIIEDGVTSVSDYFLSNYEGRWNIKSISLGVNITRIGKYAFSDCSNISSVILPDGITGLGEGCFTGCSNLGEINMPDSIMEIGSSCFGGCNKLTSVKLSNNLTSIPDSAFSSCMELENITISDKVKTIGVNAFWRCSSLQEIRLPQGLQSIGFGAFNECISLNEIFIPKTVSLDENSGNIFLECSRLESVVFEEGYTGVLPYNTFDGCSNLRDVIIPNGVTAIHSQAFRNCVRLQEITIPASVTQIEDNAFNGCENLNLIKSYTGSEAEHFANDHNISFESLGDMASISPTLTGISMEWTSHNSAKVVCVSNKDGWYYADWTTRNSEPPTFDLEQDGVPITANMEFVIDLYDLDSDNPIDAYVRVKDTDGNISKNLMFRLDESQRPEEPLVTTTWPVQIGENITAILDNDTLVLSGTGDTYNYENDLYYEDFEDYWNEWIDKESLSKIKKLIVGEGITGIGNGTFAGLVYLEEISFPKTLMTIGDYAFLGCKALESFTIPEGVTHIGQRILNKCSSLAFISFPSTLKEITCFANEYEGLPSLRTVHLAEGIEKINDFAFCHHPNLKYITLPSTVTQIGEGAFDYSGLIEITLPSNIGKVPLRAFEGDSLLKKVYLADGITSIEKYAFRECTQLQFVSIPESVKEIDPEAFYGCPNFYIKGEKGSYAEKFAKDFQITFRYADFQVTFKNNGKTIKTEFVNSGESAIPPELKREGYTLSWDGDYTNIQEDMIINAVWTKNDDEDDDPPIIIYPPEHTKYTVTFVDRGKVIKTEKVVSGEAADYPFIYRYGYELSWDKDFSKVTSNMTVNAVWTVITPEKVTSLTAEILSKSVRLSWDENEYTSYFLVYRKASNEAEYTQVGRTVKVLWADKNAKTGTEYQYKVVAVRAVSGKKYQSEDSDIVTAKLGNIEKGKTYSVGKLNYKVMNTKEVQVMGLAKLTGTVSIPSTVTIAGNIFKVTSIADKAFMQNTDIINVKVGNNITQIGQQAFYKCANLETVNLGK